MKLFQFALIFLVFFLSKHITSYKSKSKSQQCKVCNDLIENFIQGFKKTSKGNFGGGNTDWEDRKLGSYVTSDIRFEEIIENSCTNKENDCHHLLEEQEDNLLDWFKTKQNKIESDLFFHICIDKTKFCCPKETFGPDCKPCPRFNELICSGNGKCEGEGTRDGSGKCTCNQGYSGDSCFSCSNGFFEELKNDTFIKCTECHRSCQTCTDREANSCLSCKNGWTFNADSKVCEDINECLNENQCDSKHFCENTDGSFNCQKCDASCQKCTGYGSDKCVGDCNKGYEKSSDICVDINECEKNPNICSNGECVNTQGSYECKDNNNLNENAPSSNETKTNQDDNDANHDDEDFDDERDEL